MKSKRLGRFVLKPKGFKSPVVLEVWRAQNQRHKRPAPLPVSMAKVARTVKITLNNEGFSLAGVICLVFSPRYLVKNLNKRFRYVDRETDVISFSYMGRHPERSEESADPSLTLRMTAEIPLADIYISEENAAENAKRFGQKPDHEILRLAIHGVLHALGYTDDEPKAKKKMWARQEKALRQTLA